MGVNNYRPHIIILPEDDANRQIAVGFTVNCGANQIRVEKEVGGWGKVVDRFKSEYVVTMRKYSTRYVIMLIDCDNDLQRVPGIRATLPDDIAARTFVLGCFSEPEDLKRNGLGSFEEIGKRLARECSTAEGIWGHSLLSNNKPELSKLKTTACLNLQTS